MTRPPRASLRKKNRLAAVTLDVASIGRSNPDVEHERAVAIYDLLEDNNFAPNDAEEGPFALHLSITGARLVFDIRRADGTPVMAHLLSLSPLRRVVKDYYTVCDSYYAAIRTATPDRHAPGATQARPDPGQAVASPEPMRLRVLLLALLALASARLW